MMSRAVTNRALPQSNLSSNADDKKKSGANSVSNRLYNAGTAASKAKESSTRNILSERNAPPVTVLQIPNKSKPASANCNRLKTCEKDIEHQKKKVDRKSSKRDSFEAHVDSLENILEGRELLVSEDIVSSVNIVEECNGHNLRPKSRMMRFTIGNPLRNGGSMYVKNSCQQLHLPSVSEAVPSNNHNRPISANAGQRVGMVKNAVDVVDEKNCNKKSSSKSLYIHETSRDAKEAISRRPIVTSDDKACKNSSDSRRGVKRSIRSSLGSSGTSINSENNDNVQPVQKRSFRKVEANKTNEELILEVQKLMERNRQLEEERTKMMEKIVEKTE